MTDIGHSQHDLDNEYDEWQNGPDPEDVRPATIEELAEDAMHDAQEHEIDHEDPGCQCNLGGLYSLGSVESIKCGDTDPYCPLHGVEDVRSGAYASWSPKERAAFDRRLAAGMTHQ